MIFEQGSKTAEEGQKPDVATNILRSEKPVVRELVRALMPHRGGLRRWSVMRAIRNERERASRDVPQKFEADVERIFRRFCAGAEACRCVTGTELFYRPEEKAGEVWAVYPDRAEAWLTEQPFEAD